MISSFVRFLAVAAIAAVSVVSDVTGTAARAQMLVPAPAKILPVHGAPEFVLGAKSALYFDGRAAGSREAAEFLAKTLRPVTGFALPVRDVAKLPAGAAPQGGDVIFGALKTPAGSAGSTGGAAAPVSGGYTLEVVRAPSNAALVAIAAGDPAGFFHAVQTFRQLLPNEVFGSAGTAKSAPVPVQRLSIPAVSITDAPRFQWRGVLLDVARHFFTKEQIFRLLDRMAVHKLNSLQIHFTDDQAWRLEIKRFPKLTTVGAVGDIDNRNAPARFFTQDDVREIIAYAKKLHIRIVPEIEMPAHSGAAIRSYPEIACDPKKHGGGGMICPVNEKALRFYEGVLDEVCELFDSPFIHIGGDECNKSEWRKCPACNAEMKRNGWRSFNRLQSAYIAHVDKYLAAKKRRLLGWDEILEGGLAPGATVMSWRGAYHKMSAAQGGLAAAKQGRDIIFSPCDYLYLDYQQFPAVKGRSPDGRRYFGFPISVRRIFNYEPTDGIPPELRKHLLGIQANMWTEVCPNEEDLEWKLFPRLCAVAEIAWTPLPPAPAAPAASALPAAKKDANAKKDKKPADRRDYADFVRRLEGDGTGVGAAAGHLDRLRRLGIRHAPLEWKK